MCAVGTTPAGSQTPTDRGVYWPPIERASAAAPLPTLDAVRDRLPVPVLEGEDGRRFVPLYWKAWELAFTHLERPTPGSGLVADYLDAAFSDNIFLWDTAFMMRFARYGHRAFPFEGSLDNFYALQTADGFICREFRKRDGAPVMYPTRRDAINPPLLARAEWEYVLLSGDVSRAARVLPALERFAEWVGEHRSVTIDQGELYWNTPFGSGMDNTPHEPAPSQPGREAWVGMTAQVADMHAHLALLASVASAGEAGGNATRAQEHRRRAARIAQDLHDHLWDPDQRVYRRRVAPAEVGAPLAPGAVRARFVGALTIDSFWPMWMRVDEPTMPAGRAAMLRDRLMDPRGFLTDVPFATLARSEPLFDARGGYWRGASWAPTTTMAIDGLHRHAFEDDARATTRVLLLRMAEVFERTGTIWENYAPLLDDSGAARPGVPAKGDFVGWSGVAPIALLIEQVLGIRADALGVAIRAERIERGDEPTIDWTIARIDGHGLDNLRLGQGTLSLRCAAREDARASARVTITTDVRVRLRLRNGGAIWEGVVFPGVRTIDVPHRPRTAP